MENNAYATKIIEKLDRGFERATEDLDDKEWDNDTFIPNILFVSKEDEQTIVDETIKTWAMTNEVNLIEITEDNSILENIYDFATVEFANGRGRGEDYFLINEEKFNILNTPNTILYFSRIDKMENKLFRGRLMHFIKNQSVTFGDDKVYFAKNILFSVLTISDEMDKFDRREFIQDSKDGFAIIRLDD